MSGASAISTASEDFPAALEVLLDGLWTIVGTGLLHGTALAVLTLLLSRTLLKNARPALLAALWTVVLIKFLIPLGPEVPVSLSGALDSVWASDAQVTAQSFAAPDATGPTAAVTGPTGPSWWLLIRLGLLGLYLLIVSYLLTTRVRRQRRHRRWVAGQAPASGRTRIIAERAAAAVGLRRPPALRVSPDVATPHIVGLLRPLVIVPEHTLEHTPERSPESDQSADSAQRAENTLEAMLLHEFAHLRRRDTWLRAVQLAASSLFFFWPVVSWINRRIDEHREMACDQWALRHGHLSSGEYARALVAVARRMNVGQTGHIDLNGAVLGMASRGQKQLHARVDALMSGRRQPRLGLLSGLLMAGYAVISLGSATGASERIATSIDDCAIEPGLAEYILVAYPEADADGDGELSRDEVCAQKKRLEERGVFDDDTRPPVKFASTIQNDAVLASLDASKFECQACGCGLDGLEIADSTPQPLDRKICTSSSN